MLSKSQISFIKSLHQKKYRKAHGLFIIEGIKSISEFIPADFQIHSIYVLSEYQHLLPKLASNIGLFEINDRELGQISTLQAPQGILALVHIPINVEMDEKSLRGEFTLVLDGVQDPGNLGTIIRTADWFGFKNVICSPNTVEVFNPKTVQSTMGSLCRVKVSYQDLPPLLKQVNIPVFGALLAGSNLYETKWGDSGLVVLGNEGKGLSQEVIDLIDQPVTIPGAGLTESLNVAVSAAIFCADIFRNLQK